jgi:hypothetical protein
MRLTAQAESARPALTIGADAQRTFSPLTTAVGPIVDAGVHLVRTLRVEGVKALTRLGHQWNALAQRDALGAVLTLPCARPRCRRAARSISAAASAASHGRLPTILPTCAGSMWRNR